MLSNDNSLEKIEFRKLHGFSYRIRIGHRILTSTLAIKLIMCLCVEGQGGGGIIY